MNSERKEPAFPQGTQIGEIGQSRGGLTKREYFAAAAMQGWLSSWPPNAAFDHFEVLTKSSVKAADMLLEELNKEPK